MATNLPEFCDRIITDVSDRMSLTLHSWANDSGYVVVRNVRIRIGPSEIVTPEIIRDIRDEAALCVAIAGKLREKPRIRVMQVNERLLSPEGMQSFKRSRALVSLDAIYFRTDRRTQDVRYRVAGRIERISDGHGARWDVHGGLAPLEPGELGHALSGADTALGDEPTTPVNWGLSRWSDVILGLEDCLRLPAHRDVPHEG